MATQTAWEPLKQVYGWVHQLAQVLDDAQLVSVEERQLRFAMLLLAMQERAADLAPPWQHAVAHLLKVTASYGPHLFFCYQIPDVPRTNNALEQAFGQVRSHERRATGRRGAFPGLVVHGAVRLQAALAGGRYVLRSRIDRRAVASNGAFAKIRVLTWPLLRHNSSR